ncbi:MAG: carbohydrate ABC transporter permease [Candidatus Onthovivens sp.]|nr:carbohydrate ABC transporter permease [Candidatus Onthovivens sp.]
MEAKEYKFVVEGFKGSTKETEKKEKTLKIVFSVFSYVFLTIFALIMMFPFYWMVLTSLKQEVFDGRFLGLTNEFFISFSNIMRKNYVDVVDPSKFDFLNYLLNTVIVLVISTIGTLFITIFASFAFARLEFKGKDLTFYIYLMTMMIPSELFVITNYISVYRYGLLEDRWGVYFAIMLPFFVNVFYIYLLNENFKQIPNELYLASKIDGKSDIKYLFKVMIPIASPTLITIVILKVISTWNAYAWPKIVTGTSGMRSEWTLISVGIRDIANFVYREGDKTFVLQSLQMAATVLVTIPLVIIFIVFRKYIMSGTSRAGIKG